MALTPAGSLFRSISCGLLIICVIPIISLIAFNKAYYAIAGSASSRASQSGEAGRRRLESGSRTVTCAKFGGSKICQYGTVRSGRKYAAYGASLFDQPGSINYCFDLPLSAMAWRRIGFDSLVYIIGDYDRCQDPSKSRFIVETLLAQDYVVLLVIQSVNANNSVTLGQVVRLFMASLVQHVDDPEGEFRCRRRFTT